MSGGYHRAVKHLLQLASYMGKYLCPILSITYLKDHYKITVQLYLIMLVLIGDMEIIILHYSSYFLVIANVGRQVEPLVPPNHQDLLPSPQHGEEILLPHSSGVEMPPIQSSPVDVEAINMPSIQSSFSEIKTAESNVVSASSLSALVLNLLVSVMHVLLVLVGMIVA